MADTKMQGIAVDKLGNIAIGAISSDTALVTGTNVNIAAYWTKGAATWDWIKQLGSMTLTNLIDIKLRVSATGSMALLYDTSMLIFISTSTGLVVSASSNPKL